MQPVNPDVSMSKSFLWEREDKNEYFERETGKSVIARGRTDPE
jgi:hypothetical protein